MQLDLIPQKNLKQIKTRAFGGVSLKKRRKIARPLIEGKIHHVVLKSRKANGKLSFYFHKQFVGDLLRARACKYFIEILDWVNMGNHLHLKVRFKDKKRFQNFLRTFTAILARKITGARRGKVFGKFWDGLVYTRILMTAFEELGLRGYFEGNHRERELGRKDREDFLTRWNQWMYRLKRVRKSNAKRLEENLEREKRKK